jgi:L-lactate dehydrogenase complex protein LldG
MGGTMIDPPAAADPLQPIRSRVAGAGRVFSAVPEIAGNCKLSAESDLADIAALDLTIVRAGFGVAETGSVLFSERELKVNAAAYLAQHLIVLLDPADIVVNLHHAYARPEFRERRYAVFHTGPSATADIEGVLIDGAQGVRSLSVLLIARTES